MGASILVMALIVLILGTIPSWPYSMDWGYYPSGLLGAALLVTIILILTGAL